MDFLSSLIAVALPYWFTEDQVAIIHQNYCQNLYFQPNAEEKLTEYGCNIYNVETEIARVKSWRY